MTSDCNCLFDGFSYALIMHSPVLLRCCHRLYRNRICLFFIASIWKWHQWIAGILPINLTENQTIFNEMGFQFCKQIFYVISIIVIRVISFLGQFDRESIRTDGRVYVQSYRYVQSSNCWEAFELRLSGKTYPPHCLAFSLRARTSGP